MLIRDVLQELNGVKQLRTDDLGFSIQKFQEQGGKAYERKLTQARHDLANVAAAIVIFEASGDPLDIARYAELHRLFRYREMYLICRDALAKEGPLSTAQLTERVMKAKGSGSHRQSAGSGRRPSRDSESRDAPPAR